MQKGGELFGFLGEFAVFYGLKMTCRAEYLFLVGIGLFDFVGKMNSNYVAEWCIAV